MKSVKFATVLKLVGCVVIAIVSVFVFERCFMVVHTIYNPTDPFLLPDTFRENARLEIEKNQIKTLETESNRLWKEVDSMRKVIKKFEKEFKPPQLQEVLVLKKRVDILFDKVIEMKDKSQQLQYQSRDNQLEEVYELGNKLGSLWGEFAELSEIQTRIQKLQNPEASKAPAPP